MPQSSQCPPRLLVTTLTHSLTATLPPPLFELVLQCPGPLPHIAHGSLAALPSNSTQWPVSQGGLLAFVLKLPTPLHVFICLQTTYHYMLLISFMPGLSPLLERVCRKRSGFFLFILLKAQYLMPGTMPGTYRDSTNIC